MQETELKKKKIKLLPLVFLMYMFISGGSFGIEDMIGTAGPGISFLVLLLLPVFWAYPYGLVCAELGAKYPEVSGMYGWIKKAFGQFPAYLIGWSTTLANYIDTAVYMVLAMEYLNTALGLGLNETQRWMLGLIFIVVICFFSLRGVDVLAFSATLSGIIIFLPLVLTVILAIPQLTVNPFTPVFGTVNPAEDINQALLIGIWLYIGYDSLHTFSDEVEGAGPLISKAFLWAVPLATAVYLIPTFIGLAAVGNWDQWSSAGPIDFVGLGRMIGGNFLMVLFSISAIIGNLSVYASYMSYGSRIIFRMAADDLFFKSLTKIHPKYGTPHVAIIASAIITGILTMGTFESLIVIDILLMLVLVLAIMLAGIALRIREDSSRKWDCFRIPIGNKAFIIMSLSPIIIACYVIASSEPAEIAAGIICILAGILLYGFFIYRQRHKQD